MKRIGRVLSSGQKKKESQVGGRKEKLLKQLCKKGGWAENKIKSLRGEASFSREEE